MTNEDIEKQSSAAAQLLRQRIDPQAAEILGDKWFAEFAQAFADYTRSNFVQAYEEAAQKALAEVLPNADPACNETAEDIAASIRALKDSLVAETASVQS